MINPSDNVDIDEVLTGLSEYVGTGKIPTCQFRLERIMAESRSAIVQMQERIDVYRKEVHLLRQSLESFIENSVVTEDDCK